MSEASPLPEDLAAIAALESEVEALELELAGTREQLARLCVERDELERELLRQEPRASIAQRGGVLGLVLGIPLGLSLTAAWLDLAWSERHLGLAAAIPFTLSAIWLLRGAWRAGRASGARGPG